MDTQKQSIDISNILSWKAVNRFNLISVPKQRRNIAVDFSWMCLVSRCQITWTASYFQSLQILIFVSDIRKSLMPRYEQNNLVSINRHYS